MTEPNTGHRTVGRPWTVDGSADDRRWYDAGCLLLADGDECVATDDLDGACRRYLVAALCFASAWERSTVTSAARRDYVVAYRFARYAAEPLIRPREP